MSSSSAPRSFSPSTADAPSLAPLTFQDRIGVPLHATRHSSRVLSQSTRIHILNDKLTDDQARQLGHLVVHLGGQLTSTPSAANIIITALTAPKRIAKHIHPDDAASKFLVSPQWLHHVQRTGLLVDPDEYAVTRRSGTKRALDDHQTESAQHSKRPRLDSDTLLDGHNATDTPSGPSQADSERPFPWQNTKFACKRPSPLKCINQALVDELEVIHAERRLTGDSYSEMAYMRALSAIKAYPRSLANAPSQADKIKGVGKKVALLVHQFFTEGRIVEAKIIRRDPAIATIKSFTELYGIGPVGAREAYNEGCRSFADVLGKGRSLATALSVSESLRILPDLRRPIPRHECESITEMIMTMLDAILPGCVHTICGGYRRGKAQSYDLDIVVGHPRASRAVLHSLFDKMKRQGLVSHVVSISTPQDDEATDVHVDVAHLVVVPPNSGGLHRRVDLVFAPETVYGAAVLGYTGSIVFERDIRVWCRSRGYKFSFTGVTRLADNVVVDTPTEESVFELFGLPFMPPRWRNCDA
ncbi:uncharacterized protein PFL1_03308 [Pseudozyma flocculosa PF-1]|uniref:DNA polymerase n=2 Tax=Pseudozyma flocculosa TaxID=84751 RepID=A0A5C3F6K0_9BASI|nr:uncharacterized protein PFL1_03308 [Pseudozyma flocculosa PF-1]EPQ29018.1 hypothetical protein PFL1_03308 [Pseudozyma flocculosa PF-1]SPO40012.1 related to DNA polymerase mu [Pseudozyma flocculosa]